MFVFSLSLSLSLSPWWLQLGTLQITRAQAGLSIHTKADVAPDSVKASVGDRENRR